MIPKRYYIQKNTNKVCGRYTTQLVKIETGTLEKIRTVIVVLVLLVQLGILFHQMGVFH